MEDGIYNAVIGGVRVVDNRFGQDGKEIEFKVGLYDANNQPLIQTEVYLEYSNRYGVGNMSQMKQWQIAENDMKRLGFQGGSDFTRLGELVNKPCRVNYRTKDKDGKPYNSPRAYFAFNTVKAVEGDVNAIMAAIRGGVATNAAPAPAPAPAAGGFGAPAAQPSPFNFPQAGGSAPAPAAGGFGAPGFPQ